MKATVVFLIATFFIWTFNGTKVNGQTVTNVELAKSNENNSTGINTQTFKNGSIAAYSRKATIQMSVDGKPFRSGDIVSIKAGQKLLIGAEMVGGRRDYCKFPDTDADLAGVAEILSRGEEGISYQINGIKSEWKLIRMEPQFTTDKYLQIKTTTNKPTAEIIVSNVKFSQTFVKLAFKTIWQFTQNGKTIQEENNAEETIYFKIAGGSDDWFLTKNIQATGIKNELVKEKLTELQSAYDSIESNFYRLNFTALQQSNRNLQNVVNSLKSTIDEVKASNPSYQSKIVFIGLPSDNPYNDISVFSDIKGNWDSLELLLNDQKQQLANLPVQPNNESNIELKKIISNYVVWQQKLPENTFKVLTRYLPDLNAETIVVPSNIYSISTGKMVNDYTKTISDFGAFIDQRIQQLQDEIQRINSTQSRLQAVKLFDGMLRSYVSSIYWAEWKNTRGSELLTLSLKDNL